MINVHGPGEAIRNNSVSTISAIGNAFQIDGVALTSPFDIEDVIYHAHDATGVGEVTFVSENVAPRITALSSSSATLERRSADGQVTIDGAFRDIGLLDTHTVIVKWGDGSDPDNDNTPGETLTSVDQLNDLFTATHHYPNGGIYSINVSVLDDNGGLASASTTAVVIGVGLVDGTLYIVGTDERDHVNLKFNKKKDELKVDAKLNQGGRHGGSDGGKDKRKGGSDGGSDGG
ncbi:MAG: hypothetical protein GY903_24070, partial [Fuerstiella sp.]|nr:hypothetical protein [Fuerstiella sp.]MCP4857571.1 hypothetical protein [Fuerstiella sp.]